MLVRGEILIYVHAILMHAKLYMYYKGQVGC